MGKLIPEPIGLVWLFPVAFRPTRTKEEGMEIKREVNGKS